MSNPTDAPPKLLPCPFAKPGNPGLAIVEKYNDDPPAWVAHCVDCCDPETGKGGNTEAEAEALWNTRTSSAPAGQGETALCPKCPECIGRGIDIEVAVLNGIQLLVSDFDQSDEFLYLKNKATNRPCRYFPRPCAGQRSSGETLCGEDRRVYQRAIRPPHVA